MALINIGEAAATRQSSESYDSAEKRTVNSYDRTVIVVDNTPNASEDAVKAASGFVIGQQHPTNVDATIRSIDVAETYAGGSIWRYEVTARYEDSSLDDDTEQQEWTYSSETRWEQMIIDAEETNNPPSMKPITNTAGQSFNVEVAHNVIVFTVSTRRAADSFVRADFIKQYVNHVNDAAWEGAGQYEALCSGITIKPDQDQRFWRLEYEFKWLTRNPNPQTNSAGWQIDLLNTSTKSREVQGGEFKYHFLKDDGTVSYKKADGVAMAELFIQDGGANDGMLSGNSGRDVVYRGPINRYRATDFTNIFAP